METSNHWTNRALANDYHAGDKVQAQLIAAENSGRGVETCTECGGEAHYNHAIGVHRCINCLKLIFN